MKDAVPSSAQSGVAGRGREASPDPPGAAAAPAGPVVPQKSGMMHRPGFKRKPEAYCVGGFGGIVLVGSLASPSSRGMF